MSTLFVAALAEELAGVHPDLDAVELGVGKVAAATTLAAHLARRPEVTLVVNVGTAGGLRGQPLGTVVEVGRVVQHDLDVDAIGALVGRPVAGGPLDLDATGPTLATGDRFVTDVVARDRLARVAALVDMEAYAIVATCHAFGVDVRVVKSVSDGADHAAAPSWQQALAICAHHLGDWLEHAGLSPGHP